MAFTYFFAPQGDRHMAKRHSEIAAFAGRHGLNQVTAKVAEGEDMEIHDLGYQIADGPIERFGSGLGAKFSINRNAFSRRDRYFAPSRPV